MITGPANSGKSTYCRFVSNRNHQLPTYVLDIDCGQPNNTLPGQVSLTKNTGEVVKAYFLNTNNPSDNPELYLKAVDALINTWTMREVNAILIVNTCGWIEGLGAALLGEVAEYLGKVSSLF